MTTQDLKTYAVRYEGCPRSSIPVDAHKWMFASGWLMFIRDGETVFAVRENLAQSFEVVHPIAPAERITP